MVMDNLQVHKMKRVGELIEGVGAEVLFLPHYSPGFSPIEETSLQQCGREQCTLLVECLG